MDKDFRYPYASGPGVNECTHPSIHGEAKTAGMLLRFMKTAPYTTWFLASPGACTITPGSLNLAADTHTIAWDSNFPAGPFDVARGSLGSLRASSGDFSSAICLRDNIVQPSATDPATPPPAAGAYYLVRCDGDTWNDGTQQKDRDPTLTACP